MDRDRLAEYARTRRLSLGWTMKEVAGRAGISHATVRSIERGDSVKDWIVWKLDRGLDWEGGSAERILNGGEPTIAGQDERPKPLTRDRCLEVIRELHDGMDPDELDRLVAQADALPDTELLEMTAELLLRAFERGRTSGDAR